MLPLIIKFGVCGVILVTRIFEEYWHFTTRENGAIFGGALSLFNSFRFAPILLASQVYFTVEL